MIAVKSGNTERFNYRKLMSPFIKQRTRAVVNPFLVSEKTKAGAPPTIFTFKYNPEQIDYKKQENASEIMPEPDPKQISWINLDGFSKEDIDTLGERFGIHILLQEDILSHGQRPKMDDVENVLYVLMNMLYYNDDTCGIEQEQISIVLTQNTVISFQEDASRDVFDPIRERLKSPTHKIRQRGADYLFYSLIDEIVDSYFRVIEKLGLRIEEIETELIQKGNKQSFQCKSMWHLFERRNAGLPHTISEPL